MAEKEPIANKKNATAERSEEEKEIEAEFRRGFG